MYILNDWVVLKFYGFVACKHDAIQCRCPHLETSKISVSMAQWMPMIFVITLSNNLDALAKCFGISVV
jgi:hypothetical protein